MKRFNYEVALNQLGVGKERLLNSNIISERVPAWVRESGFLQLFLPYLKIIGDSREQDKWVEKACEFYGIAFEWAKKDKKAGTENLKEGDYSFQVVFGNKTYDYVGVVAYERKGSVAELYGNCTGYDKTTKTSDRERIQRELDRFGKKGYKKVVLLLEFGDTVNDLIDLKFQYRGEGGKLETKSTYRTIYSALMSWRQPNNKDFDIIQSWSHEKLFWMFLQDCYYYFRNDIRRECYNKNLIEERGSDDD